MVLPSIRTCPLTWLLTPPLTLYLTHFLIRLTFPWDRHVHHSTSSWTSTFSVLLNSIKNRSVVVSQVSFLSASFCSKFLSSPPLSPLPSPLYSTLLYSKPSESCSIRSSIFFSTWLMTCAWLFTGREDWTFSRSVSVRRPAVSRSIGSENNPSVLCVHVCKLVLNYKFVPNSVT